METTAKLRFLRMSPLKVRAIADVIRGLGVAEAQKQLQFANRLASRPVLKLLNSAIANAENNHDLIKDNLYVKEIRVDQGPTLKRWQPKAHGRATPLRRRSSHISIILSERKPSQSASRRTRPKVDAPVLVKDLRDLPRDLKETPSEQSTGIKQTEKEASDIFDARRKGKHRPPEMSGKKKARKGLGQIKSFFSRKAV
ncbi:MAG: 50S ribosomal protein L22 [bacterium]